MTETTPLLRLPLLQAGQAQKEALHNEAIVMLDAIVTGLVESVGDDDPPVAPEPGRAWIVGPAPTGHWAGYPDAVAVWTQGGWRFSPAVEGMTFRLRIGGISITRGPIRWSDGAFAATAITINGSQIVGARLSGITNPGGGATVDTEGREAIAAILVTLRTHGLISS